LGQWQSEAARLAAATVQVQSRDVLLREMQHRAKNSFQIIVASIAIQRRRYAAGDAQRALDHIISRINAISLAHDQLAPREKGQIVKLSDYLRVRSVFQSNSRPRELRSRCRPTSLNYRSNVQCRWA
jgi:two-component system, sensor histidine kinase PdtaS